MSVHGLDVPRVDYFGFGGTIASLRSDGQAGAVPALTAQQIVAGLAESAGALDIRAHQVSLTPSPDITTADVLGLRERLAAAAAAGSRGAVVTQGTDSIEETSFLLDLLWDHPMPVVFSGAMRGPSQPGSEGSANLLASLRLAADPAARGLGVVVCFNDEVHSARFARKAHTSSPAAFRSPGLGPIGWVSEGRPFVAARLAARVTVEVPPGAELPPVGLVKLSLGDDGRLLDAIGRLGYAGTVVECFGGGHVPVAAIAPLQRLARAVPVVLASRAGAGDVLVDSYRFPGSEIDLMRIGLIRAGALDGLKARMLLATCLAAGYDRGRLAGAFAAVGMTTGAVVSDAPPADLPGGGGGSCGTRASRSGIERSPGHRGP